MGGHGRPYPYMMFRNIEASGVTDARRVAKVGDTVSDIREGKKRRLHLHRRYRGILGDGDGAG